MDSDGARSSGSGALAENRPGVRDVSGVVTEQLPSALYRVRLEEGSIVTAHIADRIDRNFVRVLVGDRVRIELSPMDVTRGRIVERL